MLRSSARSWSVAAAVALLLLGAGPAAAVSVDPNLFKVTVVGSGTWTNDGSGIGCAPGALPNTYDCVGAGQNLPALATMLDSWDLFLDTDPQVSLNVSLTNNSAVTQTYVVSVVLPITAIPGSTVLGGSVQGGITSDGTPGTVSSNTVSGNAIYTALIDGSAVATLFDHPTSASSGAFLSASLGSAAFGTPIPSAPGPAASSTIGIQLEFTLTPGDQASFTSIFVVDVPEPATLTLLGMGLSGLVWMGRRRAA